MEYLNFLHHLKLENTQGEGANLARDEVSLTSIPALLMLTDRRIIVF